VEAPVSESATFNILVVDDRPENARAIKAILSFPAYNVITATSGSEALRRVLKHDFAVILMDVLMPSMDGFETARLIFQREASRHIPIIFLTAVGTNVTSPYKGDSVRAVDYLIKQIHPRIFLGKGPVVVDPLCKTHRIS